MTPIVDGRGRGHPPAPGHRAVAEAGAADRRAPVVATLVRRLLRPPGCTHVTVVTGHLAEQVEALLGDGSDFGVPIAYARQPAPDGSADAVRRALAAGAQLPALVAGADHVFAKGTIDWFLQRMGRRACGDRGPPRPAAGGHAAGESVRRRRGADERAALGPRRRARALPRRSSRSAVRAGRRVRPRARRGSRGSRRRRPGNARLDACCRPDSTQLSVPG